MWYGGGEVEGELFSVLWFFVRRTFCFRSPVSWLGTPRSHLVHLMKEGDFFFSRASITFSFFVFYPGCCAQQKDARWPYLCCSFSLTLSSFLHQTSISFFFKKKLRCLGSSWEGYERLWTTDLFLVVPFFLYVLLLLMDRGIREPMTSHSKDSTLNLAPDHLHP